MKTTKLTERENRILKLTDRLVRTRVQVLPEMPLNCAYMWGFITIPRPNKQTIAVKYCFGSYDCDRTEAKKAAQSVPGVRITHFNMD